MPNAARFLRCAEPSAWFNSMKKRLAALCLILCTLVLLAVVLPRWVSLEWLTENERQLRSSVQRQPLRAWFAALGIYFLFSLIPGTSGKSVVCGWLFGFWRGFLIVDLALTAAGFVMYWLAKSVFRQVFESRFGAAAEWLRRHVEQDGVFYLLAIRFAHAPFSLVNVASGVSGVRPRTFAWTTLCGLAPGSAIFVFVGSTLPTLTQLADEGVGSFLSWPLVFALCLTAIAPIAFRAASRSWNEAT